MPQNVRLTELLGDNFKAYNYMVSSNWRIDFSKCEELVKLMVESDMAKVASEDAAMKVRTNLAEYLEKGIVK